MANNRLYLVDPESDERLLLAKSFGSGWDIWATHEALAKWLADRDPEASMGNARGATTLKVMAENDPAVEQIQAPLKVD